LSEEAREKAEKRKTEKTANDVANRLRRQRLFRGIFDWLTPALDEAQQSA